MDWIRELEHASVAGEIRPIGKGWKTMRELIEESPYGDNKVRAIVRKAINSKRGKVFIGRQKNTCGVLTRQVWYKLND